MSEAETGTTAEAGTGGGSGGRSGSRTEDHGPPGPEPDSALTAGRIHWRALRRHRMRLLLGMLLMSLHQAAEASVPVAIGVIIDQAVATGEVTTMVVSVLLLAALFVVLTLAWRFGSRQAILAFERETHQLRVEVAERALDPRGHRDGMRSGDLLSRATSDAERAADILRAGSLGVAALTALLFSSVVLLTIDVPLGIGVLVGVPLLVGGLQALAPFLTRRSAAQQEATAATTALATDMVTGLRALRGIGAQHNAAQRYRASSERTLAMTLRTATMNGVYQGVTNALSGLFLAAVAGFAGWFTWNGRLTIGEFITVVGLAQFIAEPVRMLGYCGQITATSRASAARLATVLSAPPLVEPGRLPVPGAATVPAPRPELGKGGDAAEDATKDTGNGTANGTANGTGGDTPAAVRLGLREVSYGTLHEVSLELRRGEVVGIVSHDPRDAEALLALLAGRVPQADYQGRITLDGVPAPDADIDSARRTVLVEPHETALFEGTLRANLLAGRTWAGDPDATKATDTAAAAADPGTNGTRPPQPPVTEAALQAALRAAAATDVVEAHPDGLDHKVAERGTTLSGGQRQRIGLARALLADPPVLVLHDPTTAIDAATEERVAGGLVALRSPDAAPRDTAAEGRSTLMITSSPTLLSRADRVLVLEDGRVSLTGTHAGLAATHERYREAVLR